MEAQLIAPYLEGLGLGAGLIIAIGAQNAFVLRQGLLRRYVFLTAVICTLCDALLITLGVAGMGALVARAPVLLAVATWGGAAFLFIYGLRSFRSAMRPSSLVPEDANRAAGATRRRTVLAVLGFSLLNPHVYLDTVVMLGGIGARHLPADRPAFAAGACTASLLWFFGLAYGAAFLAPLFRRPGTWRALDFLVGCVMWVIAFNLAGGALT